MTPTADDFTQHPSLQPLAPLLYVAWADGVLEPRERDAVAKASLEILEPEANAVLDAWLQPDAPPTSTELLRLHRFIRARVARLDARQRGGLVDLGFAIADGDRSGAGLRALAEVEDLLGLQGAEAARHYFAPRPPVPQTFDERTPDFDVSALRAILDGEFAEDWQRIRALVSREDMALKIGLPTDQYREKVLDWLRVLIADGIGALSFPTYAEGAGRKDRFVKTFEALAMHDLSLVVKLGVQFGLFGGAILNLGSERHHRLLLPDVASGALLGGYAMTELGHGSNVRELETVARYDPDEGVFTLHTPSVSARKEWIGNAAVHGRAMVVFAQLETLGEGHGVHAFFVPVRDESGALLPGVSIEDCGHKMGLNGVDNGRLWFDHVKVPRDYLLDRYASVNADGTYESPIASDSRRFFTMLGTLVGGRVSVASAAVTASKVALQTAVRYGALRRQFGPAGEVEQRLLDYPAHAESLLTRVAATYAYHFAAVDLQKRFTNHAGEDTREIEALAAGVKALATWHGIDATQVARERCGGMGFLTLNRICQMRKDVDVFATFEGDNTVLLQLVAKGLLTGFAKQLQSDLIGTLLGTVAERAKRAVIEQNPVTRRRTDDAHLLSEEFHRDAFHFRTHNLLVSAARRVKKRTDAGKDAFTASIEIQDHLIALARAHTLEHVHAGFADHIAALPTGAERDALEAMRSLFALAELRDSAGWYLESEYFDASKARAVRKLVQQRCGDLRDSAVAYVDAFGVPDENARSDRL
ncbi:MAG: acyl-CoA dehydrogenase [Myxococcota bacterium]